MTVWITISTVRKSGRDSEKFELSTAGEMTLLTDGCVLLYPESEAIGLSGVMTTMTLKKDCVTMSRRGTLNTLMVMELGKRTHCDYDAGYGRLLMGIYTSEILIDIDENGGEARFCYTLDINAGITSEHLIMVKVSV